MLNRHDFEDWLKRQPPNSTPAKESCPISTYLQSIGINTQSVGAYRIKILSGTIIDPPQWAEQFMLAVDEIPSNFKDSFLYGKGKYWSEQTPKQWLKILSKIP